MLRSFDLPSPARAPWRSNRHWLLAIALAAGLWGCASAPPATPQRQPATPEGIREALAGLPDSLIVIYDFHPALVNRREVQKALQEHYPSELKNQNVDGRIQLFVEIGIAGAPTDVLIARSSGVLELDRAAIEVIRTMRFLPALRGGQPVAAWVTQWVTFEVI